MDKIVKHVLISSKSVIIRFFVIKNNLKRKKQKNYKKTHTLSTMTCVMLNL